MIFWWSWDRPEIYMIFTKFLESNMTTKMFFVMWIVYFTIFRAEKPDLDTLGMIWSRESTYSDHWHTKIWVKSDIFWWSWDRPEIYINFTKFYESDMSTKVILVMLIVYFTILRAEKTDLDTIKKIWARERTYSDHRHP